MNFKLPPGINPPPLNSVESALSYRVSGVVKYMPCDDYEAMNAYMELQRPLIEERRLLAQAENRSQTA